MATMPVLRRDSKGSAVEILQSLLKKALGAGWAPESDGSGYFGPRTQAAVIEFQRSKGLVQDGIVGGATWGALGVRPLPTLTATDAYDNELPAEEVPSVPTWVWFAVPLVGAVALVLLTRPRGR